MGALFVRVNGYLAQKTPKTTHHPPKTTHHPPKTTYHPPKTTHLTPKNYPLNPPKIAPKSGLKISSTTSWKNSLETPPSSTPCSPSNSTYNCFFSSCGLSIVISNWGWVVGVLVGGESFGGWWGFWWVVRVLVGFLETKLRWVLGFF